MKKDLRMAETMWYHYVNVNPKGKYGGDCVIRAIALACDQSWEQTVREMTELGIKKGLVLNDTSLYPLYLKQKGFSQMPEPRKSDNTKMSVREWLEKDGTEDEGLVLTTTDDKTKALFQVETGAIYTSAIDVWPLRYHYEEVDRPEDWDKDEPEDE